MRLVPIHHIVIFHHRMSEGERDSEKQLWRLRVFSHSGILFLLTARSSPHQCDSSLLQSRVCSFPNTDHPADVRAVDHKNVFATHRTKKTTAAVSFPAFQFHCCWECLSLNGQSQWFWAFFIGKDENLELNSSCLKQENRLATVSFLFWFGGGLLELLLRVAQFDHLYSNFWCTLLSSSFWYKWVLLWSNCYGMPDVSKEQNWICFVLCFESEQYLSRVHLKKNIMLGCWGGGAFQQRALLIWQNCQQFAGGWNYIFDFKK